MTCHAPVLDRATVDDLAVKRARRFWEPAGGSPYALSASKSAPRRRSRDAALSDPPPSLHLVLHARKLLRDQRIPLAGSPAVATPRETPVPPIPTVHPSFASYAAERVLDGPWGPGVWIVSNVVTGVEVARYPSVGLDGPGAILRHLQEEQCWRERQRKEQAG